MQVRMFSIASKLRFNAWRRIPRTLALDWLDNNLNGNVCFAMRNYQVQQKCCKTIELYQKKQKYQHRCCKKHGRVPKIPKIPILENSCEPEPGDSGWRRPPRLLQNWFYWFFWYPLSILWGSGLVLLFFFVPSQHFGKKTAKMLRGYQKYQF